ncbi:hypothetical protein O988_01902 [Pseudogymnoascus sp. VKM F-3808]|nr:hypothetical protein O988_01902 [Pseudogymnoascus sp. VKM F-3808]
MGFQGRPRVKIQYVEARSGIYEGTGMSVGPMDTPPDLPRETWSIELEWQIWWRIHRANRHLPEYVRELNGDSNLISIPQGAENELDYLTCTDIFATAWTSVTQTGFQAGDSVAIYGAGPVGLLAAYYAIRSTPLTMPRLTLRAKSIGAIPIDLRKGDPSTQILKLQTNGVQRVSDCVGLECVNPQLKPQEGYILNDALKLVAGGGGIAITGVYISGPKDKGEPLQGPQWATIPFDIASYWLKGPTINGSLVCASKAEPALRDLVTAGRVQPGFAFDYVVNIDEAPEAYQLFSKHKVQKAAIKFTH